MNNVIVKTLSKYFIGQPVENAWLFSSYARSEENTESDIDILVDFRKNAKITLFQYIRIINDLKTLTGKEFDLVEDGQLKKNAAENAENEKILIYERETTR